ncbi:hypothetical protein NDU88_001542 [Pleurodeles waltl]|uniref:Uncharacterized protein n=1 Tax=Pleurodeles waltl TaxID=8319 RepID=A0AAV7VA07_PLEWA|nr:hypothetical protein NDU88_001542 [Pleurodeles waltl]
MYMVHWPIRQRLLHKEGFLNPLHYAPGRRPSAATAPSEEAQREAERSRTVVVKASAGGFPCKPVMRTRRQDKGEHEMSV